MLPARNGSVASVFVPAANGHIAAARLNIAKLRNPFDLFLLSPLHSLLHY